MGDGGRLTEDEPEMGKYGMASEGRFDTDDGHNNNVYTFLLSIE